MNSNLKILVVDDNHENAISLEAYFRRDYSVVKFSNVFEAIEYLKNNEVFVIISDQKMDDMLGVEFLNQCRDILPHATRILFSGHIRNDKFKESIDNGTIHYFFEKPSNAYWTDFDKAIENARLKFIEYSNR